MAKVSEVVGKKGVFYKVITQSKGSIRFSFANVFEPTKFGGEANTSSKPAYSVQLIIDKGDTDTVNAITKAIEDCKVKNNIRGKLKHEVLRDGDLEKPDDVHYKGKYFVQAKKLESMGKPYVVSKDLTPLTTDKPVVSADGNDYSDAFYSGCYGEASLNIAHYDNAFGKGVSCYLNGVQKTKEGEPLGGVSNSPFDDFE